MAVHTLNAWALWADLGLKPCFQLTKNKKHKKNGDGWKAFSCQNLREAFRALTVVLHFTLLLVQDLMESRALK